MEPALAVTKTPEHVCILAVSGERSLGVVDCSRFAGKEGWWYLNRVKVERDYQCKGIGTKMVRELQTVLEKTPGVRGILVEPGGYGSDPERLKLFYAKLGFQLKKSDRSEHMEWRKTPTRLSLVKS